MEPVKPVSPLQAWQDFSTTTFSWVVLMAWLKSRAVGCQEGVDPWAADREVCAADGAAPGLQRTVMSWRWVFLPPPPECSTLLIFDYFYLFGFYPPALKATLANGEGHRVPL